MAPALKSMPKVKNPGTAEALIAVLTSQVGYREGRNNDTFFGSWYDMNHQPWCAMFISWGAVEAGCQAIIPRHAYTPAGAQWFKDRDQWGDKPRVGAIVYFDTAGLGRISHVGVVTKVYRDGSFDTIEGNTNDGGSREGNGVYRKRRRVVGTRGGFAYPAYKKVAKPEPKPVEKPAPAKNSQQGNPRVVAMKPALKPGATHSQVVILQDCLRKLGYMEKGKKSTDFYGPVTQAAVAAWHNDNTRFKASGVKKDRAIGPKGFLALQRQAGRR